MTGGGRSEWERIAFLQYLFIAEEKPEMLTELKLQEKN